MYCICKVVLFSRHL